MKKDLSIQIIRVVSMFSIILCHLVTNHVIGQFLTFGIYTFLFMSGYLYSEKNLGNKKMWLLKQYKKITIPVCIYLVFVIIVFLIQRMQFDWKKIFVYLFDIQYFTKGVLGMTHLWFVSVIMICYVLTLCKEYIKRLFWNPVFLAVLFLLICGVAFINEKICDLFFMIFTYFLGMSYKEKEKKIKYNIFLTGIICVLALSLKIVAHYFIDETPIYNSIIYFVVHLSLAYSLFTTVKYVCTKVKLKYNKVLDYLDNISYYVYITHYALIVGPISLISCTRYYYLNCFIIIILSFVIATLLKLLSDKLKLLLSRVELRKAC